MQPSLENAAEAGMWLVEQGNCQAIYHAMSEDDLERIMRHPATMIASDGGIQVFGKTAPHPRSYGTFARVLGVYVRERHTITLEDAIRRYTFQPARIMGLRDRGMIREGLAADLMVFDLASIGIKEDEVTHDGPSGTPRRVQGAEGVHHVVVGGQVVLEHGKHTGAFPGRVLRAGREH